MSTPSRFISIDQNSHPLWDPLPKLAAAASHGAVGIHYIEDVDVAFTRRGAAVGDPTLELTRECVYRDGQSDWGAALFYTEFLGRNPLDIRGIEPVVGMSLSSLARAMNTDVDGLYARWSISDNWQLVGSSYMGDKRVHRLLGDVTIQEVLPLIRNLWQRARQDMARAFADREAQTRLDRWFRTELDRLDRMTTELGDCSLAELYRCWMAAHLPEGTALGLTSSLFRVGAVPTAGQRLLLEFAADYDRLVPLYNAAVDEAAVGVSRLHAKRGELPFFTVWNRDGHWVRTEAFLREGRIDAGLASWKWTDTDLVWKQMSRDGVVALTGKALLLVLQARLGPEHPALLLPEHGSLYMPAAFRLERKLREAGLVPADLPSVHRVCLDFIRRLQHSRVRIVLPPYLATVMRCREIGAADLAAALPEAVNRSKQLLESLRDADMREAFLDATFPDDRKRIAELDQHRRRLARDPARRRDAGKLWDEIREIKKRVLERFVELVVCHMHTRAAGYWNSRGAILPWSIALGGEQFYEHLLRNARIVVDHGHAGESPARPETAGGTDEKDRKDARDRARTRRGAHRLSPPPETAGFSSKDGGVTL
ncbi:MAG: hypothetical protein GXP31_10835 [Kiritimatiellaeota bacterium]|nr:hypothetical protein [Kiritimatiellota bacterium]